MCLLLLVFPPSFPQTRMLLRKTPNIIYLNILALSMSSADLRQLIKLGDIDKLEQLVYEGQGKKLVGYQFTSDPKVKDFLKTIPSLMVIKLKQNPKNR